MTSSEIFPRLEKNLTFYCVLYLSPGDYHRFHSPGTLTLKERWHIVGYLNPVKPSYLNTHIVIFSLR